MKKNGFIATSLIYSFFLIFITLFLSVIADYLQNKVLLDTIEKGIKDDINTTMGIKDFEVGDMVGIVSSCDKINTSDESLYTIASVIVDDTSKCSNDEDNCLILYGVKLGDDYTETVSYEDIVKDIDFGYQNNTYYNKIIYNFDTSSGDNSYNLGDGYNAYKNESSCSTETNNYSSNLNCIKKDSATNSNYRERKILNESEASSGNRFKKCISSDMTGIIYIEK